MGLLTIKKQITSTLVLNEGQTVALYNLAMRCLSEAHDIDSDFRIEPEESSLLGNIVKDYESSGILEIVNTYESEK